MRPRCREEKKQDREHVKGNASSNLHGDNPLHNFASSHKCAHGASPCWLTLRGAACETEAAGSCRQFRTGVNFNEQESAVRFVLSASRTVVASARRAGASMREARLPFDLAGRSYVDARDARPRPSRMPGADGGAVGKDRENSHRHAGDLQLVPQSGAAGEDALDDRSHQQRPSRNRLRRGLDGRGVQGLRLPVSVDGHAAQDVRGRPAHHEGDVRARSA